MPCELSGCLPARGKAGSINHVVEAHFEFLHQKVTGHPWLILHIMKIFFELLFHDSVYSFHPLFHSHLLAELSLWPSSFFPMNARRVRFSDHSTLGRTATVTFSKQF